MKKNTTVILNDYIYKNIKLARLLGIKSDAAADLVNKYVVKLKGVDDIDYYDKSTWKYYMNLCGEYHETDSTMKIISIDTGEEIEFNKINLTYHTATAEAYKVGTRYYNNLTHQYSKQIPLIKGILYPANLNYCISSDDFSIVSYPEHLVEDNEFTLINELDAWIKNYCHRWFIRPFGNTNELYITAFFNSLYNHILLKLFNMRLKRCKSYEVHSFHLSQYFSSHENLDKYIPYLTDNQKMWLYRNINYIERNNGKVHMFNTLIDHIFTERGIPVAEISVRHVSDFDEKFKPEILVRRKLLNININKAQKDYITVDSLYQKETPLAYLNKEYFQEKSKSITNKLKLSNSSVLQTKDLESAMLDMSDAVPYPLVTVLTNLFAFCSVNGIRNGAVTYKDIKTGELVSIKAKDAFIYMQYLFNKSINRDIEDYKFYISVRVPINPKPQINDLLSVVDTKSFPDLYEIANFLILNQPNIVNTFSASAFFNMGYNFYENQIAQWRLISRTEDMYKRAFIENMVNKLYKDVLIDIDLEGKTIEDWLSSKNLPIYDFSYDDAIKQIFEIFKSAVGLNIDETKLMKNIQKAMVSLFLQLSSYTIQFITEINDSNIVPLNWAVIRIGDIKETGVCSFNIRISDNYVKYSCKELQKVKIDIKLDSGCRSITKYNLFKYNIPVNNFNYTMGDNSKCVQFRINNFIYNVRKPQQISGEINSANN